MTIVVYYVNVFLNLLNYRYPMLLVILAWITRRIISPRFIEAFLRTTLSVKGNCYSWESLSGTELEYSIHSNHLILRLVSEAVYALLYMDGVFVVHAYFKRL